MYCMQEGGRWKGGGKQETITYKSYIDQVYTWYETDSDKRATVYDPTDCPSRRRGRACISYISRIYQAPCLFPGPRRRRRELGIPDRCRRPIDWCRLYHLLEIVDLHSPLVPLQMARRRFSHHHGYHDDLERAVSISFSISISISVSVLVFVFVSR